MWVLARNPTKYYEQYEQEVKTLVDKLGFNHFWNRYEKTGHEGC